MGFTDLISRLSSGKALPPSYYEADILFASTDKCRNILSKRDCFNSVKMNSLDIP